MEDLRKQVEKTEKIGSEKIAVPYVRDVSFPDPENLKQNQQTAGMSLKVIAFVTSNSKDEAKQRLLECIRIPKPKAKEKKSIFFSAAVAITSDGVKYHGHVVQVKGSISKVFMPVVIELQKEGIALDLSTFWSSRN